MNLLILVVKKFKLLTLWFGAIYFIKFVFSQTVISCQIISYFLTAKCP